MYVQLSRQRPKNAGQADCVANCMCTVCFSCSSVATPCKPRDQKAWYRLDHKEGCMVMGSIRSSYTVVCWAEKSVCMELSRVPRPGQSYLHKLQLVQGPTLLCVHPSVCLLQNTQSQLTHIILQPWHIGVVA